MFYAKLKLTPAALGLPALGLLLGSIWITTGCTAAPPTRTVAASPTPSPSGQTLPITAIAKTATATIQLEVAKTPEQQAMGLMFRPALPNDRGMLFPMEPARRVGFWMRNVPVALDMVFLYQGKIVAIAAAVPSCQTPSCPTYGPSGLVDQVIELRAGRAQELGLKAGDSVEVSPIIAGQK